MGGNPLADSPTTSLQGSHHSHGLSSMMNAHGGDHNPLLQPFMGSPYPSHTGSLEDLKARRSQNMTECVPVPTSEHVAEIVGRQGCKIKALRTKTNTYIKTPVRGEEPVFVVTGRKEDVGLAKREILSAADHFSQIRASRTKNSINSTLAFGQLVANQPGQTTVQVRVPYRVVGLVVGPKGATIKRIQQQTHTYIVTPSRDKEPVFEVTGLPENVEAARKEIEAHIAMRTGNDGNSSNGMGGLGLYNMELNNVEDHNSFNGYSSSSSAFSSGGLDGPLVNNLSATSSQNKFNSILNGGGPDSAFSSLTSSGNSGKGITLQNILDSSNNFGGGNDSLQRHQNSGAGNGTGGMARNVPWSNGGADSHDSGIGNSPPFDKNGHHSVLDALHHEHRAAPDNGTGIWGELNKMLGHLDLNGSSTSSNGMSTRSNGTGQISANETNGSSNNPLMNNLLNAANRFTAGHDLLNNDFLGSNEVGSSSNGSSNGHPHLQHRASVSSEPSSVLFHDQELANLTDGICSEAVHPIGRGSLERVGHPKRSSSSSNLFANDDQVIGGSRQSPPSNGPASATKEDEFITFPN
eukprot:maker-scaffold91_size383040-snap-gene-1.28 protein:Tk03183 transcript:maker-scaffold91_size383040-snap-gene-1.28-mRNA-1 annotation:"hypothetical protein TcasGA2_TC001207"